MNKPYFKTTVLAPAIQPGSSSNPRVAEDHVDAIRCTGLLEMNDPQIRAALRAHLASTHQDEPDVLIVDELGLRHGAARVDLAVLNGSLHGYEIKSDGDTLRRLPSQIELFSTVLDQATLVVGVRHFDRARCLIPEWWGITLAVNDAAGAVLITIRPPRNNPAPDPVALARLLWRDEALKLLVDIGSSAGFLSAPRRKLYERLAAETDRDQLRSLVLHQLRSRTAWPPAARQTLGGG